MLQRIQPLLTGVLLTNLVIVPTLKAETRTITIDGSSTVYPITEAVAEEFQKSVRGAIRVTAGISGTGGGFKKFCSGKTDIQDASRPISKDEMANCKTAGITYIELPVAFDALTVVVSQKNTFLKEITVEQLKKIWEPAAEKKITHWNQVNPSWPNQPIKLYGPGTDSGTFDYFTEAIVGKAKSSRSDYTSSEDDNTLVTGIKNDPFAIGYFGYAYFEANQTSLRAVAIRSAQGTTAISPTPTTVENGTYHPLSRPLFIYVSAKSLKRPEVQKLTEFYLSNAASLAKQVKYIALPSKAYELGTKHLNAGKMGSVFAGSAKPGQKIEDILRLESRLD